MKNKFVHLHTHSHYSLLDGACKIEKLLAKVKAFGMDTIGLTDHGNLFGAIEFYQQALHLGIKPIIGIEAYIAPGNRKEKRDSKEAKESNFHLTLLAKNVDGYKNLMRLSTLAYREGFYYKPRMDKELLAKYSEGLIALSGCPNSEFGVASERDRYDKALAAADQYKSIFGAENFYLEIQNHGMDVEKKVTSYAIKAAKELGLKLVATNDIHYIEKDDAKAHDVLLAINTGKSVKDENRLKYHAPEFYIKSPDEMHTLFAEFPEAIASTLEIGQKCNIVLTFDHTHLPHFTPPEVISSTEFLHKLCKEGLKRRYGEITSQITERLKYELSVIEKMGFVNYFLVVWDFVNFSKDNGIPVGPGRGSSAGSLVAYALGITNVDPLKYGLIFERFLNPSRKEMPDIDVDFCQSERQRVIEYVRQKYGKDKVSQIITFGTMKARQVVRDVGRALDIDLKRVDFIAKKISPELNLKDAIERESELLQLKESDTQISELFDVAARLEGLYRHASKHASGIVISDRELYEDVPLYVSGDEECTQYDMDALLKLNIFKMDILGLETLTVLDKALKIIHQKGIKLDIDNIPLDDQKTFDLLSKGYVRGVFQLESSSGMRDLVQKMKPDCFDDIVATIALYRPGPMRGGKEDNIAKYINCKHGVEKPTYIHPMFEQILKETNGVMLYQEQVMMVANRIGGFSMAEADRLRKAMGKKLPEIIEPFREQFIAGAKKNGLDKETAEEVFQWIYFFGGYGFNKSHSVAYAVIAYRTAYLKANYPVEFMTAILSCSKSNLDKVAGYIDECRAMGIKVLPPDINASDLDFTVEGQNIRFGLSAIKNIGDKAVEEIVRARQKVGKFSSFYQFCESVNVGVVDKKVIECLIKCGAFDSLGSKRAQLVAILDSALGLANQSQQQKKAGQLSFFGGQGNNNLKLPEINEYSEKEMLTFEMELLGVYVTSDPLLEHESTLRLFSTAEIEFLKDLDDGSEVIVGGSIREIKTKLVKNGARKGEKYVTLKFRDFTSTCDAVLFTDSMERNKEHIKKDYICFLAGRVDTKREEPSIRVNRIVPVNQTNEFLTGSMTIDIEPRLLTGNALSELKDTLKSSHGSTPVIFEVSSQTDRAIIKTSKDYFITPSEDLIKKLGGIVGKERLHFSAKVKFKSDEKSYQRANARGK